MFANRILNYCGIGSTLSSEPDPPTGVLKSDLKVEYENLGKFESALCNYRSTFISVAVHGH